MLKYIKKYIFALAEIYNILYISKQLILSINTYRRIMSSISFDEMINQEFSSFEILEMEIKGKLFTIINKKILQNNWSQKEAADILGVSQPRISNIKNLYHDKFSIEKLLKFADILGCNIKVNSNKSLNIVVSE